MDEQRRANILGLALAHGLVNLGHLRDAAGREEPDLFQALMALGVIDEQDMEALERSVERRTGGSRGSDSTPSNPSGTGDPVSQGQGSDPHPELLWATAPRAEDNGATPGRQVLSALTLPAWKHYRNLTFIGEGSMGRIFKAFDPTLRRMVALKFLKREDPAMVQRFILEAQHQGGLDHPNICKVYEVGDWQGQPYIAMQFIRGEMLNVAAPAMTLPEKVQVMETVAEAIHAAHRQGLIHRDLKPANILIGRTEDRRPKPHVLDFGLARGLLDSGLTIQGMVLGTVHYMAPEQTRGDVTRIGRQTDVYGLGATLYRILAGQPPFASSEGLECIRLAAEEDVEPLRKLVPDLPADLDTIVMKCLEKDPDRRYATARELAEDLRRFLDGEPIRARTPTASYRLAKWGRKHKAMVVVAGASLTAILALAGWGVSIRYSASARARWAQHFGQQAERLEAQLRYAHLLPIHDISIERREAEQVMQGMARDVRSAGGLASGPGDYARGRGFLALGDPEQAKPLLERAWKEGFHSPEVSYAYGQVLGRLYQRDLEQAQRIEQAELRKARLADLRRKLREPALWHLRAGAAIEASTYPDALMAFYEGRLDEALSKAQEAFRARPWFFEAKKLEGEILLAKAQALQAPDAILAALAPATEAFHAAQRVAPSDASLYLGEARTWRETMDQDWVTGRDPKAALEACRAATAKAAAVEPRSAAPLGVMAWALGSWARQSHDRGRDASQPLGEALELAERALALDPGNREARIARALVYSYQGRYLLEARLDPHSQLRQAIADSQWLLTQDPGDAQASAVAISAFHWLLSYEIYAGQQPWASFEGELGLILRTLSQHPGLAQLHQELSGTWSERADYEQSNGMDPRYSVLQAVQQAQQAIAINGTDFRAHYYLGNAHLVAAQYALAQGRDPRPDGNLAIQAYSKALDLNPKTFRTCLVLGETQLLLGQFELDQHRDPALALAAAATWLAKGLAINPKYPALYLRQGQARLLQAQWALASNQDPQRELQEAQKPLRLALDLAPHDQEVLIAQVNLFRLRAEAAGSHGQGDLNRAESFLTQALGNRARSADVHLAGGLLKAVQARRTGLAADVQAAQTMLRQAQVLNHNLEQRVAPLLRSLGH